MIQYNNFLIKREQSQACLSFAKREKSRLLAKTLLTLVALIAVTTGAWADEQSESFNTTGVQLVFTGEHFTISGQKADTDGLWIGNAGGSDNTVTISSRNGENITKIEAVVSYLQNWGDTKLATTSGEVTGTYDVGQTITISSVNATTVTLSGPEGELKLIEFNSWTIYYGDAPTAIALTWDAATPNTATLTNGMPAGNVTVSVDYFAQAEFAMSTGETPVALAPTAIDDVPANTDAPIVTPGTVANIGTSEVKQGTLMYFVSQPTGNTIPDAPDYDTDGWSENVPTANGLKQGDVYVWYYIKGAEPDNIADRTDDNTRNDSDIKPLGTTGIVTLLPEPTYTVEFAEGTNPEAPAEPEWTATPNTGVKKGQTVTVTYTGDRKVIGVKAEKKAAPKLLNFSPLGQIFYYYEGETWGQAIQNHPENAANGWYIEEFGITVMYKGRALCDSAHDDDITKDTVVNPNGGYLWGPES